MTTAAASRPAFQPALLHVPMRVPLVSIATAKAMLRVNEDEIHDLITVGEFEWAFNIASADVSRLEVRILAECIGDYDERLKSGQARRPVRKKDDWAELLKKVFPNSHHKPAVTGVDLQFAFSCVSEHVLNLVREKSLACVPGSNWQRGPGGSPCITLASVKEFLRNRRLPQ